ncbi:hypothetical protein O3G_MSEX007772 [Manduca sexta]|uniref:U6 small nuclear RNA (adenine-(43)-N(6))-methyltransferase n=2 Tax=Manduca sexta TaxID=7130 RepID=A0A921Z7I4_MANSE|nr:hypothetical protein O3G_MSEX007772 [Manduca sexta]KAG6452832.1 hypothetical protein O3G_MSEX007772 [Manduca sexta]
MVGTESDADSFLKAQENIQKNKLESLIELKKNTSSTLITYLFTDETPYTFDFCMCNPPFYSSLQELYESRSPARPPPKNGFTGSPHELITEGGELKFCRKLLKESKEQKDKIRIFTTMVGHKYNLAELIQDLKADKIIYTHTEFCQGRVTRWGLAWTFQDYNIHELVPSRDKLRKKTLPLTYLLPELPNCVYNVETAVTKIKNMLIDLNMMYKVIEKRGNNICLDVIAKTNTWSNQRRKKRMMKRIEAENVKKIKHDTADKVDAEQHVNDAVDASSSLISNGSSISPIPETNDHTQNITETEHVIHAILKVIKKENDVLLQMELVDGTAGKEGLHQIIQYIKNNWK